MEKININECELTDTSNWACVDCVFKNDLLHCPRDKNGNFICRQNSNIYVWRKKENKL